LSRLACIAWRSGWVALLGGVVGYVCVYLAARWQNPNWTDAQILLYTWPAPAIAVGAILLGIGLLGWADSMDTRRRISRD